MRNTTQEQDNFDLVLATSNIRQLQLAQLFPGIEQQRVEIGAIDPDTKHPNQVDMLYVVAIARHLRAKFIFEFGTYLGRTTYHLAASEEVEKVYTLDLDPASDPIDIPKLGAAVTAVLERGLQGVFFRGTQYESRIQQLHGDSRLYDYSSFEKCMDLIFIDAGHTYEMVLNDTQKALPMLRPGGVLIWHDFAPKSPGVVNFAKEMSKMQSLFWILDTSLLLMVDGMDSMRFTPIVPEYARSRLKP